VKEAGKYAKTDLKITRASTGMNASFRIWTRKS